MQAPSNRYPVRTEKIPCLASRLPGVMPGFRVYPLNPAAPPRLLRAAARDHARRFRTQCYLVMHPKRCLLFRPDGSWEATDAPHGWLFPQRPAWDGEDDL